MSQLVSTNNGPIGGGAFQAIYPGTIQNITTSGSSTQSSAFQATTTIVRLLATEDAYVQFGSNPTATSSSLYLKAGVVEYFGVSPGSKIAVLQVSNAGVVSAVEGA